MSASSSQPSIPNTLGGRPTGPGSGSGSSSGPSTSDQLREMLRKHIQRSGRMLKLLDLATYLIGWVAVLAGGILFFCLVEHWVLPLPVVLRWTVWVVMVFATGWLVARYVLPLIIRRINPDYVAYRIEQAEPELKSGLVSWLQLEALPDNGVPRGIMAGLARHAARFIEPDDPSQSLDTRQLIKTVATTLLLSMCLIVYGMLSPKSVIHTAQRLLMPWASIAPPSRVQLLALKPGDGEVTQGKPLEVDVELRGLRPSEEVAVRYSTLDGQILDQVKKLDAITEGFHYVGQVSTASATSGPSSRGVQHELDYWIEAGDLRSGPYRITLSRLPAVTLKEIRLDYPAYTKLPPRTLTTGEFEAVEGTVAHVTAQSNQLMRRGQLEIDPEVDALGNLVRADAVLDMQADERLIVGKWLLRLNAARENPTPASYRVRGFNQRGDANEEPIEYRVSILADVPPEISVPGPENRTLRMLAGGQMNIEIRANDPDFGLSKIALTVAQNGMAVKEALLLSSDGTIGRQVKNWRFRASDFKASVGDRFTFVATAEDNRHDPVTGEPAANKSQSEVLTVEIVAPQKLNETDANHKPPATLPEPDPEVQPSSSTSAGDNSNSQQSAQNGSGQSAPSDGQTSKTPNGSNGKSGNANSDRPDQAPSENPRNDGSPDGREPAGNQSTNRQDSNSQGSKATGEQNQSPNQNSAGSGGQGGDSSNSQSSNASGASGGGGSSAGNQNKSTSQSGQSGSGSGQSSSSAGSQNSAQSGSSSNGSTGAAGSATAAPGSGGTSGESGRGQGSTKSSNSANAGGNSSSAQPGDGQSTQTTGAGQRNAAGGSQGGAGANQGESKPSDGDAFKQIRDFMNGRKPDSSANQSPTNTDGKGASGQSPPRSSDANQGSPSGQSPQGNDPKQPSGQNANGQSSPSTKSDSNSTKPNDSANGSSTQPNDTTQPTSQNDPQKTGSQQGSQQGGSQQGGSQQGGSQQGGSQQGGSQQGGSQPGGSQQGGSQQGGSQQGGSQQGGSQQGGSQQGGSQQGGSQQGGSQQGGSQQGGSQQGGSQQGGSQQGGSQQGSQQGGSQPSGSQQGGSQQGGSQQGGSQQGGSQQGGSQQGGSQQGGSQQGGSQQGGSQQGGSQQGGSQQGGSQQGGSQQGGSQQGGSQQGGSQQGGSQQGGGSPSSSKGQNGSGSGQSGGQGGGGGRAAGNNNSAGDALPAPKSLDNQTGPNAPANEDYAKQATNMVLDYLKQQKDQPDPDLLRQLNWTKDDLQNFLNRWESARNLGLSPDPNRQRQWEEQLRSLGLTDPYTQGPAALGNDNKMKGLQDSGSRIRAPESLRKQFEAFRKAAQSADQ